MDEVKIICDCSSPLWSNFVSPLAVSIAAIAAYFGVVRQIQSGRSIAKDRATIDFLMNRMKDDNFFRCYNRVLALCGDQNLKIEEFANFDRRYDKDTQCFRYVLNHYEYLAVGVKNNMYNEQMLKDAIFSTTCQVWKRSRPFVEKLRRLRSSTAYCEFELLANRWEQSGKT